MKLNDTEQKVKAFLENAGYDVLKGSYPDFIVYDKAEKQFFFVEVKRNSKDKLSRGQSETLEVLKSLGASCHVVHADRLSEMLFLDLFNTEEGATTTWLSPYEERILEAIMEEGDVKSAAFELKIQPSTIYSVVSHIRLKLVKSQNTVNTLNSRTKKSHALKRLLIPLQRVAIPVSEAEGSEAEEAEELLRA